MVACFAFNCDWIAEVTPSKYPNSVAVTADTAIFPEPLDANALEAVKSVSWTVDIAPSTLDPIKLSKVDPFCVIAVAFKVAAVIIPTSKFEAVTGDKLTLLEGSLVSLSLNVLALSS